MSIQYPYPKTALAALLIGAGRKYHLNKTQLATALNVHYSTLIVHLYYKDKGISLQTFMNLAEGLCELNKMPISYNLNQLYQAIKQGNIINDEKEDRYKKLGIYRP